MGERALRFHVVSSKISKVKECLNAGSYYAPSVWMMDARGYSLFSRVELKGGMAEV